MANVATESDATVVTMVIESRSPHETKSWGRRLASILEGGELLGGVRRRLDADVGKTLRRFGAVDGLYAGSTDRRKRTFAGTLISKY